MKKLMIKLLLKIQNRIIKSKQAYKKSLFKNNATIADSVTFIESANCINKSGNKDSIVIGENCDIGAIIRVNGVGKITIGDYTTIRAQSVVGATQSIIIGNFVIISNNVHIYDNNNHPTDPNTRIEMCKSGFYSHMWNWENSHSSPIIIEDNVWIGERSTILKGVKIGIGSIVGCDSVVTKDVPPYCIAAGNPAKVVKKIDPKGCNEKYEN